MMYKINYSYAHDHTNPLKEFPTRENSRQFVFSTNKICRIVRLNRFWLFFGGNKTTQSALRSI